MIDWGSYDFHPVVHLPDEYEVRDFTTGDYSPSKSEYDIGRYDELRPGMYATELFAGARFLHVGIDIGAPVGTPCMAFANGEISHFGYNPADGDYGNVVITKHRLDGTTIWALYGHLDAASIIGKSVGQRVTAGEVICHMGPREETEVGILTCTSNSPTPSQRPTTSPEWLTPRTAKMPWRNILIRGLYSGRFTESKRDGL